jgi:hypothetical protein
MISREMREKGNFLNSRIIIYAVRPFRWKDEFPKVNVVDPEYSRQIEQKWTGKLGFLANRRNGRANA